MRYLILLLLLIPLAGAEQVFEDWVYDKNSFSVQGVPFSLRIGGAGYVAEVTIDNKRLIIDLGNCEQSSGITVCFNQSFYDQHTNDKRAYLLIDYQKPNITINRSITNNVLDVGEETEIESIIKNIGDATAKDIVFIDSFPKEVEILRVSGCTRMADKIYWRGTLEPVDKQICRYEIRAIGGAESTLRAEASYNDGYNDITRLSDKINLVTEEVLGLDYEISNETISVGQKSRLDINLSNLIDSTIDIQKFIIRVPDGLDVDRTSMHGQYPEYEWSGKLTGEDSKELYVTFVGKKLGSSSIVIDLEYETDDLLINQEPQNINLEVTDYGVQIDSNLEDGDLIDDDQNSYLVMWLKNLNNHSSIRDIDIRFRTNLTYLSDKRFEEVEGGRSIKIIDHAFIVPDVDSKRSFPIDMNITFTTQGGERLSHEITREVVVEPRAKIVISKSISDKELEGGEEAEVTVKVKNNRNTDLYDVYVFEKFSEEIDKRGITTRTLNLKSGEEVTAYTYTIRAPVQYKRNNITIETYARYYQDGKPETTTQSMQITDYGYLHLIVTPKLLDIVITKNTEEDVYMGEMIHIEYTVENEGNETADNLYFHFSEDQNFDVIDKRSYYLERLEPEEKHTFSKERVRPKAEGLLTMDKTRFSYNDKYGNHFTDESDTLKIGVDESYIQGPALILTKSTDKLEYKRGEKAKISIAVKNVGNAEARASLSDNKKHWDITVLPGEEITLSYEEKQYEDRALPKANATYSYNSHTYHAYSNSLSLDIYEDESSKSKPDIVDASDQEKKQTVKTEAQTGDSKNFIMRLVDTILGWFGG